jgi:hypothetical protein
MMSSQASENALINRLSAPFCAVVDAAVCPQVFQVIDDDALATHRLYWGEMGEIHHSLSPYLLVNPSIDWLVTLSEEQPNWGIAFVFDDPLINQDEESLFIRAKRFWQTWIQVKDTYQQTVLLRLFDRQVFQALWHASSDTEKQALSGPFKYALFGTLNDNERETLPLRPEAADKATCPPLPRALSETQYAALLNLSLPKQYQAYKTHLQTHHERTQAWSETQWTQFIETGVSEASANGFQQQQDIVRFLSLKIELGDTFYQEAWAQKIITRPIIDGQKTPMDRLFEQALILLDKESSSS